MARNDRERHFEEALARNFRSHARQAAAQGSTCADPEILAAYHAQLLEADQASFWKKHISGCSRCEEILAQLAATDEIPLNEAAKPRPAAFLSQITKFRSVSWRFLIPAGAFAAGLLVWLTLHRTTIPQVEVAKNQPTAPAPLASTRLAPAPPAREVPSDGAPGSETRAPVGRSQPNQLKLQARAYQDTKTFAPASSPKSPASAGATNEVVTPPDIASEPTPRDRATDALQNKDLNRQSNQNAIAQAAPAPLPVPAPPPKPAAMTQTVEVTAAAPPSKAVAKQKEAAPVPSPSSPQEQQQMAGRSLYRASAEIASANPRDFATISAPSGSAQWRVGKAGVIEQSTDAGATWSLQSSGVIADLISGSAASDKVCWIVGRAGTILRTTDGGIHWEKIHPPVVGDFTSVFAVNSQQATVSLSQGSYQTTDGGFTWTKLAPE